MFNAFSVGLGVADAAMVALEVLTTLKPPLGYKDEEIIRAVNSQSEELIEYHKKRTIKTFSTALGIDITPVLNDAEVNSWMQGWRVHNISLIKTIPQVFHERLERRMTETFAERPFDRAALRKVLSEEFRSTGYNLRRLTRDQTTKAIGNLTHIRQVSMGVERYRWRSSQDERVRDEHRALNGTIQRWDTEPDEGHPGYAIQCRCTAQAILRDLGRPDPSPEYKEAARRPLSSRPIDDLPPPDPNRPEQPGGASRMPYGRGAGTNFDHPPGRSAYGGDDDGFYPQGAADYHGRFNIYVLPEEQVPRAEAWPDNPVHFTRDPGGDPQAGNVYASDQAGIFFLELRHGYHKVMTRENAQNLVDDIARSAGIDPYPVVRVDAPGLEAYHAAFAKAGIETPDHHLYNNWYDPTRSGDAFTDPLGQVMVLFNYRTEEGRLIDGASPITVMHEASHMVNDEKSGWALYHRRHDVGDVDFFDTPPEPEAGYFSCGHGKGFCDVALDVYEMWGGKDRAQMEWVMREFKASSATINRHSDSPGGRIKPASMGHFTVASVGRDDVFVRPQPLSAPRLEPDRDSPRWRVQDRLSEEELRQDRVARSRWGDGATLIAEPPDRHFIAAPEPPPEPPPTPTTEPPPASTPKPPPEPEPPAPMFEETLEEAVDAFSAAVQEREWAQYYRPHEYPASTLGIEDLERALDDAIYDPRPQSSARQEYLDRFRGYYLDNELLSTRHPLNSWAAGRKTKLAKKLYRGGRLTATDQRALDTINLEMNELPDNTPILYRGLSYLEPTGDAQWGALRPGTEIEFKAPTSTSTELETAAQYVYPKNGEPQGLRTFFEIHPAPGVRGIAYNADDQEVLLDAGQTFVIMDVRYTADDDGTIAYATGYLRPD